MRILRKWTGRDHARLRVAAALGVPAAIDAVYRYELRRIRDMNERALSRLPAELALTVRLRAIPGWPGPDPQPVLSCAMLQHLPLPLRSRRNERIEFAEAQL